MTMPMNTTTRNNHRSIVQLLLTVAGLAGIPALFLPFTSVAPYSSLDDLIWALALPFSLSVPISIASLRLIVSGTLSRPERMIAYFASIATASVTLSLYAVGQNWNGQDWLGLVISIVTLILGVYVVLRSWRMATPRELSALMSMQAAYLSNCLLCLMIFFGEWQIGAYFALATAVAYSVHIVRCSLKRSGRSTA